MRWILLSALLMPVVGQAAPPPNADANLAPWFNSLRDPTNQSSCCSLADCRNYNTKFINMHYSVFINNEWLEVPDDKILNRTDNPTGHAVVCYAPTIGIMCFVKAPDS